MNFTQDIQKAYDILGRRQQNLHLILSTGSINSFTCKGTPY
jgi:hypothetical protein